VFKLVTFTFTPLPNIKIMPTKKSAHDIESYASEGLLASKGDRDTDEDKDKVKESEDIVHKWLIPWPMKSHRMPISPNFKYFILTNTILAGLFKALASGGSNNGNSNSTSAAKEGKGCLHCIVRSQPSLRKNVKHKSHPSLHKPNNNCGSSAMLLN
jgi:hypothetical protein